MFQYWVSVFEAFVALLLCDLYVSSLRDYISDFIYSMCSDGMNGYISPCAGDPHPPVFRSPVASMEDIMGNQVL